MKNTHGLTDGSWGALYTGATLFAAALMFCGDPWPIRCRLSRRAPAVTLVFAAAAIGVALAPSVAVLGIALCLLRFCGQGMFSYMAKTAMGRWFEARRRKAVLISNLGHPAGEIMVPPLVIMMLGDIGWRSTCVVAGLLCVVCAPLLFVMLSEGRTPDGHAARIARPGLHGRQWRRQDAARNWLLPVLLPVLLTPDVISTVIYFLRPTLRRSKAGRYQRIVMPVMSNGLPSARMRPMPVIGPSQSATATDA